jgi:hypothetical protein
VTASRHYAEQIVTRQCVQARLADGAIYLHAWACVLSKLDRQLRAGESGPKFDADHAAARYFIAMADRTVTDALARLFDNDDGPLLAAADAALKHVATLPNDHYRIHESSPNAAGTGAAPDLAAIKQFPGATQQPSCPRGLVGEPGNGNGNGLKHANDIH